MSYVLTSRMMPGPSWEMDLEYIESRFSSGLPIDVERLIEVAKEAGQESFDDAEEAREQLVESETERAKLEKVLGVVEKRLRFYSEMLDRYEFETTDGEEATLPGRVADQLEQLAELIRGGEEIPEVQERREHERCVACNRASVPAEHVPDQQLRGCTKCGRCWAEQL